MYIEVSYPIETNTNINLLPSVEYPKIIARSRIKNGDNSNTSYIYIYAHNGTHIDAPWHFNDSDGFTITDFCIEDFIFEKILLLEINKGRFEPILQNELEAYSKDLAKCDVLLINTGFSRFRQKSPSYYFDETPGFSEEAADYISGFKNIKCIGFDFISVENITRNREKKYPVHNILLNRQPPLIIIEDMNLKGILRRKINKLFVIPIRIQGVEASPVTVIAEIL